MIGSGPLDGRLYLADFVGVNGNWQFASDIREHCLPGGDRLKRGSSAFGGGFLCFGIGFSFFKEIFCGSNFGAALFGLFFQGLWALARSATRWPSWAWSGVQLHGRPEKMKRNRFFGGALFGGPTFDGD